MDIVTYTIDHDDDVMCLMHRTPGVSIRDADSREATERYLARNPGLRFLIVHEGRVVGCAMSGHDGRRGYLQHVIVEPEFRCQGIANLLVESCLNQLAGLGIDKTHIDVFIDNNLANGYWSRRGWKRREDIYRYSVIHSGSANA